MNSCWISEAQNTNLLITIHLILAKYVPYILLTGFNSEYCAVFKETDHTAGVMKCSVVETGLKKVYSIETFLLFTAHFGCLHSLIFVALTL